MLDTASLLAACLLGMLSSMHCVGMCGAIVGALQLASQNAGVPGRWYTLLLYNSGRILGYAGLALLLASTLDLTVGNSALGHIVLRNLAALMLALIGLHLLGWRRALAWLEIIGLRFWRWIQSLLRPLFPVRHPWQALALGLAWGLLPCGLVYSTLLWAAASGTPLQAAMRMAAFGVGTLPALVLVGYSVGSAVTANRRLRQAAGLVLVALALLVMSQSLFRTHQHHEETHQSQSSSRLSSSSTWDR